MNNTEKIIDKILYEMFHTIKNNREIILEAIQEAQKQALEEKDKIIELQAKTIEKYKKKRWEDCDIEIEQAKKEERKQTAEEIKKIVFTRIENSGASKMIRLTKVELKNEIEDEIEKYLGENHSSQRLTNNKPTAETDKTVANTRKGCGKMIDFGAYRCGSFSNVYAKTMLCPKCQEKTQ